MRGCYRYQNDIWVKYSISGGCPLKRALPPCLLQSFVSGPQMQHSVSWEGVWRELRPLARSTAFAVRENSGHTLKVGSGRVIALNSIHDPIGSQHDRVNRVRLVTRPHLAHTQVVAAARAHLRPERQRHLPLRRIAAQDEPGQ